MNYFRDFSGTHFITSSGSVGYQRSQDGHGGHGSEHRAEMEQIASQKIAEAIPGIQQNAYASAYSGLLNALSFDVTSTARGGLENCGTIFYDSKTQKVIAQAIMDQIKKHMNKP